MKTPGEKVPVLATTQNCVPLPRSRTEVANQWSVRSEGLETTGIEYGDPSEA